LGRNFAKASEECRVEWQKNGCQKKKAQAAVASVLETFTGAAVESFMALWMREVFRNARLSSMNRNAAAVS